MAVESFSRQFAKESLTLAQIRATFLAETVQFTPTEGQKLSFLIVGGGPKILSEILTLRMAFGECDIVLIDTDQQSVERARREWNLLVSLSDNKLVQAGEVIIQARDVKEEIESKYDGIFAFNIYPPLVNSLTFDHLGKALKKGGQIVVTTLLSGDSNNMIRDVINKTATVEIRLPGQMIMHPPYGVLSMKDSALWTFRKK